MDPLLFFAALFGAVGLGIGAIAADVVRRRRRGVDKKLLKIPVTAVRDAVEGKLQRFEGRVAIEQTTEMVEAPLSGRTCAGYELRLVHMKPPGGKVSARRWRRHVHVCHQLWQPFSIDDGSGRLGIVARGDAVQLDYDKSLELFGG
jgi:hypothetical protein